MHTIHEVTTVSVRPKSARVGTAPPGVKNIPDSEDPNQERDRSVAHGQKIGYSHGLTVIQNDAYAGIRF